MSDIIDEFEEPSPSRGLRKATAKLPETLLGQLIAEIAKFGGMENTKASQLARILLPHIERYVTERCGYPAGVRSNRKNLKGRPVGRRRR